MDYKKPDTDELRNTEIILAIMKPNIYRKGIVAGIMTLLIVLPFIGMFKEIWQQGILIGAVLYMSCFICNIAYLVCYGYTVDIDPTVVIGYSNKVLILSGDRVVEEIETDEIVIRSLTLEERCDYFNNSVVLETRKDGKVKNGIVVFGIRDYIGCKMQAIPEKVGEDLVLVDVEVGEED